MSPPSDSGERRDEEDAPEGPYLHASASQQARIYQAVGDQYITVTERDLHLHFVDGVRGARRAVPAVGAHICPYPGLEAFGAEQADWFFGRGQLVAGLLDRLDRQTHEGGPQILVAPSGTGKSSLLRAGLLPAIADGRLPGSARWPCAVFSPTAAPLTALAAQLAHLTGTSAQYMAQAMAFGAEYTAAVLRAALLRQQSESPQAQAPAPAPRCVIVVDQLEELFTLRAEAPTLRRFLDVLAAIADAAPDEGPAGLVVFGLRSDFYTQCAAHPQLQSALQDRQLFIGPMTESGVREAILYPARAVGLEVEPGLVEVLLRDLSALTGPTAADASGAGAGDGRYAAERLPLLAHALRATWQQRHGSVLTVDGYQSTGGIAHALANTADQLYDRLDAPGQQVARRLLLNLVKIGEGTEDVRRPMPYETLLAHSRAPDRAAEVVSVFTQARLLTRGADQVTLTHEALLRAWPRLRQWIDADRPGNLVRQELEDAAADWRHKDRDARLLYRGSRLEAAGQWADAAPADGPSTTATHFLTASLRQQRRAARVRRTVIAVLSVLVLLATGAAAYAFVERSAAQDQRSVAEGQRNTAVFNQLTAEADSLRGTNASLAAQLDLTAYRMKRTEDLRTHLLTDANIPLSTALTGYDKSVLTVAFSPDGHTLATGGDGGTLRLWNVADPAHPKKIGKPLSGAIGNINSVAFSPDGRTLATTGAKGAQLWNVSDLDSPVPVGERHNDYAVAFGPDQKKRILASAGFDGKLRLWNAADPARLTELGEPLTSGSGAISRVVFSPDGRTLATTTRDGATRLWNVTDPNRPTELGKAITGANRIAFSPDKRTLASTGRDAKVQLWNVSDPGNPRKHGEPLDGHIGVIFALAFSPDGNTLASVSGDQTARLWNVTDPALPAQLGDPLTGHTGTIYDVAFSRDGRTMATVGADRTVRVWNRPATLLTTHTRAANAVAFNRDGHTLATAGDDGKVRLWDVTDSAGATLLKVALDHHTEAVRAIAFSRNGRMLATAGGDGNIWLWDVSDPKDPTLKGKCPADDADAGADIVSVAFDRDGRTLAGAGDNEKVRLWNVTDPGRPVALGTPLTGRSVAFSPDGRTLATAGGERNVRLWDVRDPADRGSLGEPRSSQTDSIFSLAFSPDGRTLASASLDSTIQLWKATGPDRPAPLGAPRTGHTHAVVSVAFSPDGRMLASGSSDRTVRLWKVTGADGLTPLGERLTGHTEGINSVAFSPDGRTLASAAGDHTVRLWPLGIDEAEQRICAYAGSPTRQQWKQYLPQLPYKPPCRS
ncbi:WD40 repeat domain-containing protein [Streptomyces sp. NPDC050617]|uniref:WD40 repeat domain-containing protein n=1 Tax=Streptomyces sp. NPDC050617 TaxID=3154628 RepID=UPI0034200033